LRGKKVVLCVTGGIAAYKAAYLTRSLVKADAHVMVILTEAAQRFVGPLTFETLSGNPVVTSTFEAVHHMGAVEHIDLAEWADLVIVAPATYNCLGKLCAGVADDPVSTFLSAITVPTFLAPAMNENMWRNPINQRNVRELTELGYHMVPPGRGGLACSWEGEGRMAEPDDILAHVRSSLLGRDIPVVTLPEPPPAEATGGLAGRTLVVTAGGTREAIDPVRFLGNRSSGRMGYALAAEAVRRGARVLLVSGPTALQPPAGLAAFERIESADQLLEKTRQLLPQADVLLMAAAVADYRPRSTASSKLKRQASGISMDLEPTPDLLAALAPHKGERFFVGFALETDDLHREAQRKLRDKGCDWIVANRVSTQSGPDVDTNQVTIFGAQGVIMETPVLPKPAIAASILDALENALQERSVPARP
jgi:phosphopantothenoylcysteine decarboxylase/phosphopantothenate--cysteine ligase